MDLSKGAIFYVTIVYYTLHCSLYSTPHNYTRENNNRKQERKWQKSFLFGEGMIICQENPEAHWGPRKPTKNQFKKLENS